MKTLIEFIERVYLSAMTLRAQEVWLEHFAMTVNQKLQEVTAKRSIEEIDERIADGDIVGADKYTAEEIKDAVESMRRRNDIFHASKFGSYYGSRRDAWMKKQFGD